MAITLRVEKGSALTYNELDTNFTFLDNRVSVLEGQTLDLSDLTDTTGLLFDGEYASLTNKPTIPTATSELTNDSGFLTTANLFSGDYNDLENKPTIPVVPTDVGDFVNNVGYITEYVVTQDDVTQHQSALQITENQITDLGSYIVLTDLSVTTLTANGAGSLVYDNGTGGFTYTPPEIPTNVSEFINDAGYITSATDAQTLSFDGTDLTISNGNTVDLSALLDNTDAQTLSFDGTDLTISSGNTVDLSALLDNTDAQTLSLDGTDLTISSGNTVDLASIVGDSVGNFTFASSIIDTDDSSTITITPSVIVSSDLTVDNDLIISGDILTDAVGDPELVSENILTLTAPGGIVFSDIIQLPISTSAPSSPTNGMVAIGDGVSWDPASTGVQTMVVYLGGAWVQIAQA